MSGFPPRDDAAYMLLVKYCDLKGEPVSNKHVSLAANIAPSTASVRLSTARQRLADLNAAHDKHAAADEKSANEPKKAQKGRAKKDRGEEQRPKANKRKKGDAEASDNIESTTVKKGKKKTPAKGHFPPAKPTIKTEDDDGGIKMSAEDPADGEQHMNAV